MSPKSSRRDSSPRKKRDMSKKDDGEKRKKESERKKEEREEGGDGKGASSREEVQPARKDSAASASQGFHLSSSVPSPEKKIVKEETTIPPLQFKKFLSSFPFSNFCISFKIIWKSLGIGACPVWKPRSFGSEVCL